MSYSVYAQDDSSWVMEVCICELGISNGFNLYMEPVAGVVCYNKMFLVTKESITYLSI